MDQNIAKNLQLTRGYSKVQENEDLLNETRYQIEQNIHKNSIDSSLHITKNEYSFMLPDLNKFEDYKFKEFLQNDLIELPTQCALTESGHLNWWTQGEWEGVCRPLYPMSTSGDGNCLLHAASLSMWGLHDRHLVLRKALHSTLENIKENQSALWRRWKWEQMCQNKKYGLIYSDEEWSKEWKSLLKLSSYKPRVSLDAESNTTESQDGTQVYFESLEEFHVFLLAHILQRPILIVSDTMLHDSDGEPLSPIPFGGIYLPFECDINKCFRYPLVLAYDSAHFSALVLMNDLIEVQINGASINEINKILQLRTPYAVVPVTYSNNELLPIHFSYDPGENYDWSKFNQEQDLVMSRDDEMYLLQKYLDLVRIDLSEPGPVKRSSYPTNTSGLKINTVNIKVKDQIKRSASMKSKNSKIQKFLNIFKNKSEDEKDSVSETNTNDSSFSKSNNLRKSFNNKSNNFFKTLKPVKSMNSSSSQQNSSQPQVLSYSKTENPKSFDESTTIFHRIKEYSSWQDVFNSLSQQKSLLCVKLNLAKTPKYDCIISNYIDSAKLKYRKEKAQQMNRINNQHKIESSSSLNSNSSNQASIRNLKLYTEPKNELSYSYNNLNSNKIEYDNNNNLKITKSTVSYH